MRWLTAAPPSQRWAYAFTVMVTAASVPSYAQTPKARPPRVDDPNAPTTVQAEDITGRTDREVTLVEDAELVKDKTRVKSDTACYRQVENEVEADGNVRMWRYGDYFTGQHLSLNMDSGKGYVTDPTYKMEINNGRGSAERIDFINPDEAVVVDGTYSTCQAVHPDWYLKSSTMNLDQGRDVGTATDSIIYFKDVPILGTPAMSFSLSGARRSGWLPPTPGFGSKGGAELLVPYYVNIAPNRDLTLYPKLIPSRGFQFGANGRYIGETEAGTYSGDTFLEYLPHDKQTDTARWQINSSHEQALAKDWTFGWNVRAASDDNYPNDFAKTVAGSAERQLLRELRTDYRGDFWSVTARVQKYQVLQDPDATIDPSLFVPRPYDRLPSVNFTAAKYDVLGGFDWQLDAEATHFWHPDLIRGVREVLIPQISYPIVGSSYFITPKLMLNAASYQLAPFQGQGNQDLTRVVPTGSLDAGLVFERDAQLWGRAMTQTLEPRLFYVNTPYRDQSALPNFDTAAATFNFAQLFSENRYVGSDRIGDANQLTAAVVSRFLEENGAERLRLAFGQRFYFRDQRVQLDASTPVDDSRSDLLLAAAGRISEKWSFDSAVQYNTSARQVASSSISMAWRPAAFKLLNLGYSNQVGSFRNVDVSGQWPLSRRWYGVARVSYSTLDKKIIQSLVGLEYKADCWVFRMGAQRFVTTATNASTPIFFQLELNGLSKLGVGNPLEALKNSIPGYQRVNEGLGR